MGVELFKSTNGGSVWSVIDDGYFIEGGTIVADPQNDFVVYSGGKKKDTNVMAVSKSTDGGATWLRYELTITYGMTYAIAVDPSNSDIVYAGGNPQLYKSTNAGTSWFVSSTGLTGYAYSIAINPNNTNVLYAATSQGVFKTTNGGTNWMNTGLDNARAVLVNTIVPEDVYAGLGSGIFKSTNAGNSWFEMNTGLRDTSVTYLGINPGEYIFCSTEEGGMHRSSINVSVEENHEKDAVLTFRIFPTVFMQSARINIDLESLHAQDNDFTLSVYDVNGRVVKAFDQLGNDVSPANYMIWDGTDNAGQRLPDGVYFVQLEIQDYRETKKVILLK
jgi:hypothetical protein